MSTPTLVLRVTLPLGLMALLGYCLTIDSPLAAFGVFLLLAATL